MSSDADAPVKFWDWFQANGDRLIRTMYGRDADARVEAMDELTEAFAEIQPGGLVIELAGPKDEVKKFVVSADGRPERVDLVKEFVAEAPQLDGWEVVAFRTRMAIHDSLAISIQGEEISPTDVWFEVADGEGGLALDLYVRGLNDDNSNIRGLGASLLTEHALGERDAFTLLASLDAHPLPEDPANAGYRPFGDLVEMFDRAKKRKYPPPGSLKLDLDGQVGVVEGSIGGAPIFGRVILGLKPIMQHPNYDRAMILTMPYHEVTDDGLPATKEEFEQVAEYCDDIQEALEEGQQSLMAAAISGRGRRDMFFYTSDGEGALDRLEELRERIETHDIEVHLQYDTFWGFYHNFIDSREE